MPQLIVSERYRTSLRLKNLHKNGMSGVRKHIYQVIPCLTKISLRQQLQYIYLKVLDDTHLEQKWSQNQVKRDGNKTYFT